MRLQSFLINFCKTFPHDQIGGAWKPQNKVNGPIKVYRSLMHMD